MVKIATDLRLARDERGSCVCPMSLKVPSTLRDFAHPRQTPNPTRPPPVNPR